MTNLILALLVNLSAHAAGAPNFHFRYLPNEGDGALACTQTQIQDLPDWDVVCGEGANQKKFSAHVIVRQSTGEKTTTLEILYWVTARGANASTPPTFHSTTARLHFRDKAELFAMTLYQGVENDSASLVLELGPTGR